MCLRGGWRSLTGRVFCGGSDARVVCARVVCAAACVRVRVHETVDSMLRFTSSSFPHFLPLFGELELECVNILLGPQGAMPALDGIVIARGMSVCSSLAKCQLPWGIACVALHDTYTSFHVGIDKRNGCVPRSHPVHILDTTLLASSISSTHVLRECIPGNLPVGELLAWTSPASFTFHPHITFHMGHAFNDKATRRDLG